jgi:murein DD-endopeptidase MepM/ murein hydrolase activator NlpD
MVKIKELFTKKIRNRYRLIIRSDDTLRERVSVTLTPLNLVLISSGIFVACLILFIAIVPRSPLKSLLPGYDNARQGEMIYSIRERMDSLERIVAFNEIKDAQLMALLADDSSGPAEGASSGPSSSFVDEGGAESADHLIDYEPTESIGAMDRKKAPDYAFFPPVKGVVSDTFDHLYGHMAVDIVSYNNASVKATLDGTVLMSSWNPETGYVMVIQHSDDLVSIYKHNAVLLKKEGNFVSAGEVIALVGNSGELSSGPHLHFELWYDGVAINPLDYVQFN